MRKTKITVAASHAPALPALPPETVSAAVQGDDGAFRMLFAQTYRSMYFRVRRVLHGEEAIREALVVGYTKARWYIGTLDAPEEVLPWLGRLMDNAAQEVLRDSRENAAAVLPNERDASAGEQDEAAGAALSALTEQHRRLLVLRYYDKLRLRDIAALEGVTVWAVLRHIGRARRELQRLLVQHTPDSAHTRGAAGAIAALLCRALGTTLLSAAAAQDILEQVLGQKNRRAAAAAEQLLRTQRHRAVMRLGLLVAGVAVTSACLTVVLLGVPYAPLSSQPAENTSAVSTAPTVSGTAPSASVTSALVTAPPVTTTVSAVQTTVTSLATADSTAPTSAAVTTVTTTDAPTVTTTAVYVFEPDYREGYANTSTMNTPARAAASLRKGGFMDFQDEWIYLSDGRKIRKDGTGGYIRFSEETYLPEMTVIGDWVYYLGDEGIMRVRTDGRVVQTVVPHPGEDRFVDGFVFIDGKLYYSEYTTDGFGVTSRAMYACTPDGRDAVRYSEAAFSLCGVVVTENGWISIVGEVASFDPLTHTVTLLLGQHEHEMWFGWSSDWMAVTPLGGTLWLGDHCFWFPRGENVTVVGSPECCLPQTGYHLSTSQDGLRTLQLVYSKKYTTYIERTLPDEVRRSGYDQRYQADEDGRVYQLSETDGVLTLLCSFHPLGYELNIIRY